MKNLLRNVVLGLIIVGVILGIVFSFKKVEKDENVLVLGLDDNYPPMGFRNDKNEIVGFDVDLANAVCEKLGMELKLQAISWASKDQELNSGNIDCIWNGFAYTKERDESMTLSDIYLKGEMIFILKNGTDAKTQDDLVGKKIGVQTGSSGQMDLENSEFGKNCTIVQYGDYLTSFMDLEVGNIDAVFAGNINAMYLINEKNKDFVTIKSEGISTSEGNVIGFKKGNFELKDKVQGALYELKKEGKLQEISRKWFGENLIILEEE